MHTGLPIKNNPYFARVSTTFRRFMSLEKPMAFWLLLRTHEYTM